MGSVQHTVGQPAPLAPPPAPLVTQSAPVVTQLSPLVSQPPPVGTQQASLVTHTAPVISHSGPALTHSANNFGSGISHPISQSGPIVSQSAPVEHVSHQVHEIYPDEIIPFNYEYSVNDLTYSTQFKAAESDDGTGVREGTYSVALPDGRIQHVIYHTNDLDGYVAQVTYDGTAVYPDPPVLLQEDNIIA